MNHSVKMRILRVAVSVCAFSMVAQAQINLIYTFNQQYDGCCAAWAGLLAQGRDGNLYGTMPTGVSSASNGTWFEYPIGGLPVIHPLKGNPYSPYSGFTLGLDGNLYGATVHGGNAPYGVLFKIAGGHFVTLYLFSGGANGSYPSVPPLQGVDGDLYGVTYDGSTEGVVYKVNPNSGALVWARPLPSGSRAPLILASDGNFYGTYSHGGMTINGVAAANDNGGGVFRVTPAGVVTGVYNINPLNRVTNGGYGDGGQPWGPVMQAADGKLYGTAGGDGRYNGGTVFKVGLDGSGFTVLHNFQAADGTAPQGGLVQAADNNLYGLCSGGGIGQGVEIPEGSLFKMDTGGMNFVNLFSFYRASGASGVGPGSVPLATPTMHTDGTLYGVTSTGGTGAVGSSTYGAYDDGGEMFSYKTGTSPFIVVAGRRSAAVNDRVGIIGQGFLAATGVKFGGVSASWSPATVNIVSDTYMEVVVPAGARTGPVWVTTPTDTYSTLYKFVITCNGPCISPMEP